jgi:hypothetical protein
VGCFSYKIYRLFQTQHSFGVTIFIRGEDERDLGVGGVNE